MKNSNIQDNSICAVCTVCEGQKKNIQQKKKRMYCDFLFHSCFFIMLYRKWIRMKHRDCLLCTLYFYCVSCVSSILHSIYDLPSCILFKYSSRKKREWMEWSLRKETHDQQIIRCTWWRKKKEKTKIVNIPNQLYKYITCVRVKSKWNVSSFKFRMHLTLLLFQLKVFDVVLILKTLRTVFYFN